VTVGILALQGDVQEHAAAFAEVGVATRAVRRPADLAGLSGIVLPGGESTTLSMLLESSGLFDPLAAGLAAGLPAFGTCAGLVLLARHVLDGRPDQRSFGVLDCTVRRNGYGRQRFSFESVLRAPALTGGGGPGVGAGRNWPDDGSGSGPGAGPRSGPDDDPGSGPGAGPGSRPDDDPGSGPGADSVTAGLPAVFIRAPVVVAVGPGVEVLATLPPAPGDESGAAPDPVVCRQGPVLASAFHPELTGDRRLHRLFAAMAGEGGAAGVGEGVTTGTRAAAAGSGRCRGGE
jgi:5'-phosphate synthase pdxT subunit